MNRKPQTITLIGAGLSGPVLAIGLVQRGFKVEIYERRPDMRQVQVSAGRSINLALSTRGIYALSQAGLWKGLKTIIIPMKGRIMHALSGDLAFQPYGREESQVINSISRAELNMALMSAAEGAGVTIHFEKRCTGIDLKTGTIQIRDEQTGVGTSHESEVVIGCDGSASAIRNEMLKLNRFNFSQQYLDYGYKELTIPANSAGEHSFDKHALHIWPRGNYMLIALPNVDGTFACILFLPFEGKDSFAQLTTPRGFSDFFSHRFSDAAALMPQLTENYFANPTGSMVTVKCSPWHVGARALLVGDAAHAIVPFFGQGLNCGFEDCTILLQLLDQKGPDWPRVFEEFAQSRKINTDAIADMAVENFTEMRDRVGDPRFLFRKKVELALEAKFPGVFVPKYAMVTFHRVPYSIALVRGMTQDKMLDQICEGIDHVEGIDWGKARQLVETELIPLEHAQ